MSQIVRWPPSWSTLFLIPALFVGFTVHELAHALVAYLLGDTSQMERKRLSLNPLRHVSWLGMVAFMLVGLGWAKPVWVDPSRFRIRNRDLGLFLVSIAGSTANFLVALLALVGITATMMVVWTMTGSSPVDILQYMMAQELELNAQGLVVALSYYMMTVNLLLALFNLLPIPPLDGFLAVTSLFNLIRNRITGKGAEGAPSEPLPEAVDADEPDRSPAEIHFDIALEYHRKGEWDEAIARYRQAIAHDDAFALAYYNQGLAYWAKGRLPLAVSSFRAASQPGADPGVMVQAGQRLRELEGAELDSAAGADSIPAPLERGAAAGPGTSPPAALDPVVVRRTWLRLAVGGVIVVILAVAAWLFVTAATMSAMA
jgi:Zn-dependent protease